MESCNPTLETEEVTEADLPLGSRPAVVLAAGGRLAAEAVEGSALRMDSLVQKAPAGETWSVTLTAVEEYEYTPYGVPTVRSLGEGGVSVLRVWDEAAGAAVAEGGVLVSNPREGRDGGPYLSASDSPPGASTQTARVAGSAGQYGYVGGNPISRIDPTGLAARGAEFANSLDDSMDSAANRLQGRRTRWTWKDTMMTAADVLQGSTGSIGFRTGAAGDRERLSVSLCDTFSDSGKLEASTQDVGRCSALMLMMAAPVSLGRNADPSGGNCPPTVVLIRIANSWIPPIR